MMLEAVLVKLETRGTRGKDFGSKHLGRNLFEKFLILDVGEFVW